MTPIREAATVCLVRPTPAGLETLLLRRPDKGTFPGAWVFPGGVVEDIDRAEAVDEDVIRRRAGVRETEEEAGLSIAAASLTPVSRWIPPEEAPARFDTWMYLATASPDAHARTDGDEIVDHLWISPQAALDRHAASQLEFMPPTWIALHTLAGCGSPQEAHARVSSRTQDSFTSQLEDIDGQRILLWHGDVAYRTGVPLDSPGPRHRMSISDRPWQYDRTTND